MPSEATTASEFAIVGGGVAGLALAIAFQQLGKDFRLFEQSQELKGIGAGFGLAANAMQALDLLQLKTEVEKLGYYVKSYPILDEQGRVLLAPDTQAISQQYQQQNFAIHRADLHLFLLSKIQKEHLQLGKKALRLQKQSDRINLSFADGSQHSCRYLILADGIKSPLRQQLLPKASPRYAGYTCWRATINQRELSLPHGSETWGKAGRFGMTPLTHDRIYWYACINAPAQSSKHRNYSTQDLYRQFQAYHSPIPEIIAQTQDQELIWSDIMDIKPLRHLAYDNILLIGDAGHATTPNMGQGACQALEDVAVLQQVLTKGYAIRQAFIIFEKKRLARTRYITNTSRYIGAIAQWEQPGLIALRNQLMRWMPAEVAQSPLNKLLAVDFMKI